MNTTEAPVVRVYVALMPNDSFERPRPICDITPELINDQTDERLIKIIGYTLLPHVRSLAIRAEEGKR